MFLDNDGTTIALASNAYKNGVSSSSLAIYILISYSIKLSATNFANIHSWIWLFFSLMSFLYMPI